MTPRLAPVPHVEPEARGFLPERLDIRHYPSGHVWRRDRAHETMVLAIRERLCIGEEATKGPARRKLMEVGR